MNTKVFSVEGKELRDIELDDRVFGCRVNDGTVFYAIRNELANARVGTASTKTRGEVQGSSTKPWAQKGTGRARAGRRRSPVWVGGGTIFGPRPRDYSYSMPKKMKRVAMKSILSMKVKEESLKVVEDFTIESGKTKELAAILGKLVPSQRTVVVLGNDDAMLKRAGRNIPWVTFLSFNRLRAHDLFYGKNIVVLEAAVTKLNEFYA
ncbi:MAG TPA: 50S ribosomal protein L4 [Spirochaetia bacterium]|nr:50S ribosomal protein L4 [Spirochaetia bacterium]